MTHHPRNPFEFGRVLGAEEIIDREEEIQAVRRTIANRGKLFLIGPRRFGKSSVLKAAAELEEREGAVVLRFDAEKYETLDALSRALLLAATRRLEGSWERAAAAVGRFFARLLPEITMDPASGEMSVRLGAVRSGGDDLPALTMVLDGIEAMGQESNRPVAVFLDEFQRVARDRAAEGRIRATVQEHGAVAYVFAGSQTTLLREMTGASDRPFYRLGERLFLDAVPRAAFRDFIHAALARTGFESSEPAVERILDRAADVPFNVQQLAHYAWEEIRAEGGAFDVDRVEAALERLVRNEDPFYTHLWAELTENQRKALKAVAELGGRELYGQASTEAYGLSASSMQAGVRDLIRRGLVREVHEAGAEGVRLVDPFFARWLEVVQRNTG